MAKDAHRNRFTHGGVWMASANGKAIPFHLENPRPEGDPMLVTLRTTRGMVTVGENQGRKITLPLPYDGLPFEVASLSAGKATVVAAAGESVIASGTVDFRGTEVTDMRVGVWRLVRIAVLFVLVSQLLGAGAVPGLEILEASSMDPYLRLEERFFYWKGGRWFGLPTRGEVIVFWREVDAEKVVAISGARKDAMAKVLFVKRVIGLPGDEVLVEGDAVWVNGEQLVEGYITRGVHAFSLGPVTVPEGHLFVMGDNRPSSEDSRSWVLEAQGGLILEGSEGGQPHGGFVPRETVAGTPILAFWPFSDARWLK